VVTNPSCAVLDVGGLGGIILEGGDGGASCAVGDIETRDSPFSCSSILLVRGFPWVLLVELLLCDVCIFEVVVAVPDFVVFGRITCPLGSVL